MPRTYFKRRCAGHRFCDRHRPFFTALDAPFRVRPGNDETATALRTVCETVAKAACQILEIESGEILAEYRPALTEAGAAGLEAEIFIYDTLAGGAGFSPQLAGNGTTLFDAALNVLASCPASCDASCYRCLRSFRNKLDHRSLDRYIGEQLLRHAIRGGYPPYPVERIRASLDILFADLSRQFSDDFEIVREASTQFQTQRITIPILVRNRSSKREAWIALSSPIAPAVPAQSDLPAALVADAALPITCVDDLLIRRHLPEAVQTAMRSLR